MNKRFKSKIIVLLMAISLMVSVFSTNMYAAGGDIINEKDIIDIGSPIGVWNLDEGEGTTVIDSSGNNMNGTFVYDNVYYYRYWKLGKERSGVRCTPSFDSYVSIPQKSRFNFSKKESFTISAWIKRDYHIENKWQGVITHGRHTDQWYGIWISANNRWVFGGQGQNIHGSYVTEGWHQVVIVQDGAANKRYLYVDGALVGSGNALDGFKYAPLLFGKAGGTDEHFNGIIDEVYLYDYALSYNQIFDWYTRMKYTLNVPVYGYGQYSNISWATSSSMILSYFRGEYGDLDIYITKNKHGDKDFNKPTTPSYVMEYIESMTNYKASRAYGSLTYSQVYLEIKHKKPFIAITRRKDSNDNLTNNSHYVVIRGYFDNNNEYSPTSKKEYIHVNDPAGNGSTKLLYYDYFLCLSWSRCKNNTEVHF